MQLSIFDGTNEFKIKKPIRLIELFAGYGSQYLALKYLGVEVESYRICEWAVKTIQAYKDLHFENDTKDYSADITTERVINYLANKGISADYNEPMSIEQIRRLDESKCRQIYNNIQATHNLVNITQVHANDLNIVDTDKYDYIMTYSFPCQDLSKAGLGKGMKKNSGTRSGLLWEVERILDECEQKPQILIMENVPDVIGTKNIEHFAKWLQKLESLGYYCKWQVLNSIDYGIPQNRERCFMVSILDDNVYYDFSKKQKLELRLKDLLEDNVDEKYYLSDNIINYFESHTRECIEKGNNFRFEPKDGNCVAKAITTRTGSRMDDNFISNEETLKLLSKNKAIKKTIENKDLDNEYFLDFYNRTINKNGVSNAITTRIDASTTSGVAVTNNSIQLKRKSCNNLIQENLVKENDAIKHSYTKSRMNRKIKDMKQNNISSTLYTRCDCSGVCANVKPKIEQVYNLSGGNQQPKILQSSEKSLWTDTNKKMITENGDVKRYINSDVIDNFNSGDCADISFPNGYNKANRVFNGYAPAINTTTTKSFITKTQTLRIRKLTPKECFRLMGVKDEDYEKVAKNQSNASLYHLAGDSIVVNVLMAIFGQMFDTYK